GGGGGGGGGAACAYEPGSQNYKMLYRYVKNGGRYANTHTGGDRDIDYVLEVIDKASQEAGLTPDQVRARRHTFDHLTMAPRPDQIPTIKKLGMVVGGSPFYFFENSPRILAQYGEDAVQWVMPKKSLVDAGIPNGFEIDRPLATTKSLTVFWTLARMIDRKAPQDGKVYAPSQRVGRELALKTATYWGAYYMMRENLLGSLEPGKWADFIVLDRDYLTIPETDIENIGVLMTVVGGKPMNLVPSLARTLGMQPTGSQIELGGPAAQW
ncbi:MAG: amidohydrolase family protein, partial [Acidobacteria bacterium]|nr:amidohydrolase family protein [Acidobacteriota bacterium]